MPRLNDVYVVGLVAEMPSIKYDKENQPVQAAMQIVAIHGIRSYGERLACGSVNSSDIQNKGYDNLWITTKDPGQIQQMMECKEYDAVEVKGCLRVTVTQKKAFCPECGEKHSYPSTKTTIYPIYFAKREGIADKFGVTTFVNNNVPADTEERIRKAGLQYLKDRIEISNVVKLIGVICKEPQLYKRDADKRIMMSVAMAVKRKYFVPEDDMRTNVDFPYLKLYGKEAIAQADVLHQGNLIMVDGFLQSRSIIRRVECEHCGVKFSVNDTATEVVPYSIEYIRENVSDTTPAIQRPTGLRPQIIGSEADVDLKQRTAEESMDEATASGYIPSAEEQSILSAVSAMND